MITKQNIQHIARLARIELTPEEEEKFGKELSAILGFVEKLNEVDTTGVEPMTGGAVLENITRPDEQVDQSLENKSAGLVSAAPDKKDEFIRVKKVFE